MQKFTANVIFTRGTDARHWGRALEARGCGYEVAVIHEANGLIVQNEAHDIEDFLSELEDFLPDDAVIDDHGEAA